MHYHPEGRACHLFEQRLSTENARMALLDFRRGVSWIRDMARRLQGKA